MGKQTTKKKPTKEKPQKKAALIKHGPKALTPKEQLFVKYFALTLNKTQAALLAGYSEKTARQIGYENLTKLHIRLEVERELSERFNENVITHGDVIKQLNSIGFSNIRHFIEKKDDGTFGIVDLEELPAELTAAVKSIKSTKILVHQDNEDEGYVERETLQIILHDSVGALKELRRHYGNILPKGSKIKNYVFFVPGFQPAKEAPVPKEIKAKNG